MSWNSFRRAFRNSSVSYTLPELKERNIVGTLRLPLLRFCCNFAEFRKCSFNLYWIKTRFVWQNPFYSAPLSSAYTISNISTRTGKLRIFGSIMEYQEKSMYFHIRYKFCSFGLPHTSTKHIHGAIFGNLCICAFVKTSMECQSFREYGRCVNVCIKSQTKLQKVVPFDFNLKFPQHLNNKHASSRLVSVLMSLVDHYCGIWIESIMKPFRQRNFSWIIETMRE